jgi:ECF sigma factor
MPLVYKELPRMARFYAARESRGHTLQTTARVNEAYVSLVDSAHTNFQSNSFSRRQRTRGGNQQIRIEVSNAVSVCGKLAVKSPGFMGLN